MMGSRFIIYFICSIVICSKHLSAQTDSTLKYRFDKARNLLLSGKTQKALPLLKGLSTSFPENSNISYLLGVCLTETDEPTDMSIYYLEKAKKDASKDYSPNTHLEERAPIFVHYFLVVAYAQNRLCLKAQAALENFKEAYGDQRRDFYIQDGEWWIENCQTPEELVKTEAPSKEIFEGELIEQEVPLPKETNSRKKEYITKAVHYSTFNNLYGVQVGAFSKVVPIYDFKGLKNVNAFMDKKGMIRYVIGHFSSRKQAESLLKVVVEAGYPDAYIVNVNKEIKYKDELVIYNNQSLLKKKESPDNQISFSVQIGAFRDSIPNDLAQKYLLVDDIKEIKQDDLVVLISGLYKNYKEASDYKSQLTEIGIPGTFVIGIKNGEKIILEKHHIQD